jgi:hypothetical protein
MTAKTKRALNLVGAAASLLVAANTALGLSDRVRKVDILLLFATGMSAGVTLTGAVRQIKEGRSD